MLPLNYAFFNLWAMNACLSTCANYSVATYYFGIQRLFRVLSSEFCYLDIRILNSEFWNLTTVDLNSESWLVSRSCSCDQNFIIHDRCLEFVFCNCCRRSDRNDHYHKIVLFIRAGLSHIFFSVDFSSLISTRSSTGNDVSPIMISLIFRNSEPCSGLVK